MSEMVERIARAIFESDMKWAPIVEHQFEENRQMYFAAARAAIEALREPSDQMIDAVYKNEFIQAMRPEDLYAAWESMLGAALGETP